MFGYISGTFSAYTFQALWQETPRNIRVLFQEARRERRRRENEYANGALMAASKQGVDRLNKREAAGL